MKIEMYVNITKPVMSENGIINKTTSFDVKFPIEKHHTEDQAILLQLVNDLKFLRETDLDEFCDLLYGCNGYHMNYGTTKVTAYLEDADTWEDARAEEYY